MIQTDKSRGAMLGQNEGITSLPLLAPLDPRAVVFVPILILAKSRAALSQHAVDKRPSIGADRIVDSPFELAQLRRIDIDDSFPGSAGELLWIPTHQRRIKASSDYEDEVSILQGEVRAPRCDRAGPADE